MTTPAVKPVKPPKEKKPRKPVEKTVLVDFLSIAPSSILNSEGALTVADPSAHGYNPKVHEKLGRKDFDSETTFLTFRCASLRELSAKLLAKADRLEQDAKTAEMFGDPDQRKAVKKMNKMVAALADLRKSLAADGIDVDALLATPPAE